MACCLPPQRAIGARSGPKLPDSENMIKKGHRITAPRLWLVITKSYRVLRLLAERSIASAGLGLTDFAALEALLHKGPLTISEIQGKVPLAIGSMTAAVDRLEKKGLIMRTPAAGDRRAKVLKLTAEGRRIVEQAFSRHAADLESVMAVLNASEKRQL